MDYTATYSLRTHTSEMQSPLGWQEVLASSGNGRTPLRQQNRVSFLKAHAARELDSKLLELMRSITLTDQNNYFICTWNNSTKPDSH